MTDIYEKPPLDELMHFGVKGMKWGRRSSPKPSSIARKEANADLRTQRKLSKSSYKGVRADRKAIKERIKDRQANDPEYREALKKIDRRAEVAVKIETTAAIGTFMAFPLIALHGDRIVAAGARGSLRGASAAYRGASRAANSEFVRGAARNVRNRARYNPNSPLWDGFTVSSTAVKASMDLVRRYG